MPDSFKPSSIELTGSIGANYIVEEKEKRHKKININFKLCSVSDRVDGGGKPL